MDFLEGSSELNHISKLWLKFLLGKSLGYGLSSNSGVSRWELESHHCFKGRLKSYYKVPVALCLKTL